MEILIGQLDKITIYSYVLLMTGLEQERSDPVTRLIAWHILNPPSYTDPTPVSAQA